eukprot:1137609-Lingulodinium_polyedra.AAC.1
MLEEPRGPYGQHGIPNTGTAFHENFELLGTVLQNLPKHGLDASEGNVLRGDARRPGDVSMDQRVPTLDPALAYRREAHPCCEDLQMW